MPYHIDQLRSHFALHYPACPDEHRDAVADIVLTEETPGVKLKAAVRESMTHYVRSNLTDHDAFRKRYKMAPSESHAIYADDVCDIINGWKGKPAAAFALPGPGKLAEPPSALTTEKLARFFEEHFPACPEAHRIAIIFEIQKRDIRDLRITRAVDTIMRTYIRHEITDYDSRLKVEGTSQRRARKDVKEKVDSIIALWRQLHQTPPP